MTLSDKTQELLEWNAKKLTQDAKQAVKELAAHKKAMRKLDLQRRRDSHKVAREQLINERAWSMFKLKQFRQDVKLSRIMVELQLGLPDGHLTKYEKGLLPCSETTHNALYQFYAKHVK